MNLMTDPRNMPQKASLMHKGRMHGQREKRRQTMIVADHCCLPPFSLANALTSSSFRMHFSPLTIHEEYKSVRVTLHGQLECYFFWEVLHRLRPNWSIRVSDRYATGKTCQLQCLTINLREGHVWKPAVRRNDRLSSAQTTHLKSHKEVCCKHVHAVLPKHSRLALSLFSTCCC